MQYNWINKKNNEHLIIFFSGWGMDENPFVHLDMESFDVLVFSDYSNLEIPQNLINKINSYKKSYLISWSMGVFVGNILSKNFYNIENSIAINGTLEPISDEFGIPSKIYDITLKRMSEKTLDQFFRNMFDNEADFLRFYENMPKRSLLSQKNELQNLKELINNIEIDFKNIYDFAIISSNDQIFPSENMLNFWSSKQIKLQTLHSCHYPFYEWKSWKEIISYAKNQ